MIGGGFGQIYSQVGVDNYYEKTGHNYANPHKYDIERLIKKKLANNNPYIKKDDKILDLACGSGEVTMPLKQLGYTSIEGIDPYTSEKFTEVTGI
jgi:ubiquinone/menaquinone biosynthesis C-methylase UbiE